MTAGAGAGAGKLKIDAAGLEERFRTVVAEEERVLAGNLAAVLLKGQWKRGSGERSLREGE